MREWDNRLRPGRLPRASARIMVAAAVAAFVPSAAHAAEEQSSDNAADFSSAVGISGSAGLVGAYGATVGGNAGAAYLFRNLDTATGTITQDVKLTASDGASGDQFGNAASLSGSIGLAGAPQATVGGNTGQGAAYLFRNLDTATGTITQDVKLTASDGASINYFGSAISLSGTMGLVGAWGVRVGGNTEGAAYLFRNLDTATGTITQNAKLTASDTATLNFGNAVSLSGTFGLVGASDATVGSNPYQGAAYLFRNLNTATGTITQDVRLIASDGAISNQLGFAVSLSGATGLAGAPYAGTASTGAAYLFRNLDTATGTITQNAKLTASDGAATNQFGKAISFSGSTGLVGAPGAAVGFNTGQGAAYLFRNLDTATGTITQDVKLTASDGTSSNNFGSVVSLDGDRFLIGTFNTNKAYSGTVSSMTTLDTGNSAQTISRVSFVSQDAWIIGQTTSLNQVTLSKGDTANVTASGMGVFVGQTAGSNGNALLVQGTLIAGAVTISAPSGASGNTLQIVNDGNATAGTVSASGGITVNPGGKLALSGASSVTDRIGNSTPVTLAGGTLDLGGLSEGTAGNVGIGSLSVTAASTIDFGTPGTHNVVQFAGVGSHTTGQIMRVVNWEGTALVPGGPDRLLFSGLASSFVLAYPQSDVSFNGITGYEVTQDTGFFEVYAAPEPGALILSTIGAPILLQRRRRQRSPI